MLTRTEIERLGLIENADPNCFREASYDVRIDQVIQPDGGSSEIYAMPPQGIAEVISQERIAVPRYIGGFAMVKTSLCNEGILPLNIGIIDPGYSGRVSSFLVNFGRADRILKKDDVFLRLVFHRLDGDITEPKISNIEDSKYIRDKKAHFKERFGTEFLDVAAITERFAKNTFNEYKNKALGYVAASGFLLAILTFCLNFGNLLLVQRFLQPTDAIKAELFKENLDHSGIEHEHRMKEMVEKFSALENALNQKSEQLDSALARIQVIERSAAPAHLNRSGH
jgi:deoxycytidine triphosphate deaminase